MDFKFTITDKNDYTVIGLEGSLIEIHQADNLLMQIEDLFIQDKIKFILDLSRLEFINNTGIALLVRLFCKVRKNGGELALCNLSNTIQQADEGKKIMKVFNHFDNEKEATALLSQ